MVILLKSVNNDVGGGGKQKTQSELHNNEQKTLLKIQIMLQKQMFLKLVNISLWVVMSETVLGEG